MGGHLYQRPGRRKKATTCVTNESHKEDITKGLEFLGNWLINITQTEYNEIKKDLLIKTFETFLPFINKLSSTIPSQNNFTITNQEKISLSEPPSLFMIKTIFIETSKKNKRDVKNQTKIEDYEVIFYTFIISNYL